MKKKSLIIILFYCFSMFLCFSTENLLHLDDSNFYNEVKGKLVFVDFYADWCGPCVYFGPIFEKTAARMTGEVFAKVNVDNAGNVSGDYGVQYIPFIAALNDGEFIEQYTGNRNEQDFYKWCKEISAKYKNDQTSSNNSSNNNEGVYKVTSTSEFYKILKEDKNKLIIVDFYADWCGPCNSLAPIMEELAEEYSDTVNFLKVDIDKLGELSSEYNIEYIPHVVFIKNETVIDKLTGLYEKDKYTDLIQQYSKEEYAKDDNNDTDTTTGKIIKIKSEEEFYKYVSSPAPLIIDFYADWCGPCSKIAPYMENLAQDNPGIVFLKVDIDTQTGLAKEYNISAIPYVVYMLNGKIIEEVTGAYNKSYYASLIDNFEITEETQADNKDTNENYVIDLTEYNSYINVKNSSSLDISDNITLSAWIKASYFDEYDWKNPVISKHGNASGWELRTGNGQAVMMVTIDGKHQYAASQSILQPGRWYHLTGTYDGNEIKIYVNGKLEDTNELKINGNITVYQGNLNIGRNDQWTDRIYYGLIDDAAIWNRVLSSSEIKKVYNGNIMENSKNLVLYYDFNDSSGGNYIKDRSGKNNTGIIEGDARVVLKEQGLGVRSKSGKSANVPLSVTIDN